MENICCDKENCKDKAVGKIWFGTKWWFYCRKHLEELRKAGWDSSIKLLSDTDIVLEE
jgi:hypothetical protein